MFYGEKSKKELLPQRLSKLLNDQIIEEDGKSNCVCNKCVRELEKYERAMCKVADMRKTYIQNSSSIKVREKRCHTSPAVGVKYFRTDPSVKSSNHRSPQKSAKRNLMPDIAMHMENAKENDTSTPPMQVDDSLILSNVNEKTNVEV